ncbi:PIG-L family deacetylase, partial [Devosia sp.]|uniref:PIG-L family deacetylase n=1 Tax=Devosia sp. TaxID=1871048 RepID=UPI002AFE63BB
MLSDRERLHRAAAQPHLVAFWRALSRLRSSLTVMNSGAHPDDEQNGMLATLRFEMGMRIVVACSTRGEGGQNTLGPERGGALGVLRSREMEAAARVIDADIAWLGHGPDDPVHDFGFSKSGKDTLARWGEDRTIERMVRAYRQFRPDIVIPTFLDVPGQHGHHRAMTEAAERALALAADPQAWPEHAEEGLAPWRVSKFYLPAWSGGGDTYDDEVPPPPVTTTITATAPDFATGLPHDRLGEVSRAFHASQNMGHWRHPGIREWPLHLVGGVAEADILAGLPQTLADLGSAEELADADAAIAQALAAFPNRQGVLDALIRARAALRTALPRLTAAEREAHGHRVERKLREIDAAMAHAVGIDVMASISSADVVPGGRADLILETDPGLAESLVVTPRLGAYFEPVPAQACTAPRIAVPLLARADAPVANPFAPDWLSLGGNGAVSVEVEAVVKGERLSFALDTEEPVQIAPRHSLSLAPQAIILKLPAAQQRHSVAIKPMIAGTSIDALPGLKVEMTETGADLMAGPGSAAGLYRLPVRVDGGQAHAVTPIAYPHIGRTRFVRPLWLDVLALDLALPKARIGYIGGGSDNVGLWLERMGASPVILDAEALAGDLSGLDTIVVGIFAYGTRPDLALANPRLHRWVKEGGHLVTLYHRPIDKWVAETTPPLPITIGTPSLRWRVTDPAAPVAMLAPDHKLFAGPNRIGADDFEGWDKERGLYFASAWDKAYEP